MTPEQQSDNDMVALAKKLGITGFDPSNDAMQEELDKRARASGTNGRGVPLTQLGTPPPAIGRRSPATTQAQEVLAKYNSNGSRAVNTNGMPGVASDQDINLVGNPVEGPQQPAAPDPNWQDKAMGDTLRAATSGGSTGGSDRINNSGDLGVDENHAQNENAGPYGGLKRTDPQDTQSLPTRDSGIQTDRNNPRNEAGGDPELSNAQRQAAAMNQRADFRQGMSRAADILQNNHHSAGVADGMRSRAKALVDDVLARRNEARTQEDQGFQRDQNTRAGIAADDLRTNTKFNQDRQLAGDARDEAELGIKKAGEGRTQTTFDTAQQYEQPGSREAKAWEAVARAKRPKEAQSISPQQAASMSANDWKAFLNYKDDPVVKLGGAGGGAKGLTANQLSKLLPENALDTFRTGNEIEDLVAQSGGWDKLNAGYVGGMAPTGALKQKEQMIRQSLAKMLGSYRKAIAGTAVTPSEAQNVERVASIIQGGKTTTELQNGFQILKDLNVNRTEQAIGLQSPEVQAHVRGLIHSKKGSIVGMEDKAPLGAAGSGGGTMMRNPKTGEMVMVSD